MIYKASFSIQSRFSTLESAGVIGENLTPPNPFPVFDEIRLPVGSLLSPPGVEVSHLLGKNASDGDFEAPKMLHVARTFASPCSRCGAELQNSRFVSSQRFPLGSQGRGREERGEGSEERRGEETGVEGRGGERRGDGGGGEGRGKEKDERIGEGVKGRGKEAWGGKGREEGVRNGERRDEREREEMRGRED